MERLKVAFIGAGRITDLHYAGYRDYDRAELVTVCDASEQTARARHREWRTRKWTADYREVLADPEIDMVEILTPHHLHCSMTLEAVEAGKHVSVQKPMSMDIGDCDRMIDAARAAGVKLRVYENFVFYPPYVLARRLIDEGEIGDPLAIRIKLTACGGGWHVPLKTWAWRMNETDHGGGPSVYDDGYHKFSIAMHLMGEVDSTFGWIDRSFGTIDSPAVIGWRHREGNRVGCMDVSFSPNLNCPSKYYAADERVEILGTRGTIHVTRCTGKLLDLPSLVLYRDGKTVAFEDVRTDWIESFKDATRHFVEAVLEDTEPMLTGQRGKAVQQFCLAAIRSAREGAEVAPDSIIGKETPA